MKTLTMPFSKIFLQTFIKCHLKVKMRAASATLENWKSENIRNVLYFTKLHKSPCDLNIKELYIR